MKVWGIAGAVLLTASAAQAQGYPSYTTMPFGRGYIHEPVPDPKIGPRFSPTPPTYTTMPFAGGWITQPT